MVEPTTTSPKVAWVSKNAASDWSEEGFILSLATYKTNFVTDAGGRNIVESEARAAVGSNLRVTDAVVGQPAAGKTLEIRVSDFAGGVEAATAAFVAVLENVDVIIDETYAASPTTYTMDSFYTGFGMSSGSTVPAIVGQKVFRQDGTISESGGLDWFESRLAHPQWVLQDLARALRGDGDTFRYLRNIAANEVPQIVEAAHCLTQLPACGDVTSPADIPLLFAITDADSAAVRPALLGALFFIGLQLW